MHFFKETKMLCFETLYDKKIYRGNPPVRVYMGILELAYMKTPIVPEVVAKLVIEGIPDMHQTKKVDNSSSMVVIIDNCRLFRLISLKD